MDSWGVLDLTSNAIARDDLGSMKRKAAMVRFKILNENKNLLGLSLFCSA